MLKKTLSILFIGFCCVAEPVFAQNYLKTLKEPGATLINGLAMTSNRYTGWVLVNEYKSIVLGVTATDANDSCTALSWTCQESNSNSTANGAGYDVCSVDTASGTSTYSCPWTGSLTTGTAAKFSFMLTNLKMAYVNCYFSWSGTPAAADVITVVNEGVITP